MRANIFIPHIPDKSTKNCQLIKNSSKYGAPIDPILPNVVLIPKAKLLTGVGYNSIE